MKLILASGSPRRIELIKQLPYDVEVVVPFTDESYDAGMQAEQICVMLAERKAQSVIERRKDAPVLAADTLVSVDGTILGKPRDRKDAVRMFRLLCGRAHDVVTGIAVGDGSRLRSGYRKSRVYFGDFNEQIVYTYIDSGASLDKAGGYGVQDLLGTLVTRVDGGIDNVIGLPLDLVQQLLEEFHGKI